MDQLTRRRITRIERQDSIFFVVGLLCTAFALVTLAMMVSDLLYRGADRIDWAFVSSFPSRVAARAGLLSALVGSVLVLLVTALTAIPLGIGAAVYLEEYSRKSRLTALIEINI